ncbi:MAG: transcriptional repressor [Clostridia bacterium]|nr:transcriptional repressor [Clostridia bacterium]
MADNKDPGRLLAARGYKLTRQRKAILNVLTGNGQHLTAEEVHQQVQSQCPAVNLVTVYRNLNLMAELGVIGRVDFGDGRARFEARAEHHHHLLCLKCGRVVELNICPLDYVTEPVTEHRFRVIGHRFKVFGYCAECKYLMEDDTGGI